MIPYYYIEVLIRLGLSVILGGIIGIERAGTNHDAGLRTHILVCLGAAGVMITSEAMTAEYNCDIGRIGAQVVSGIGFLGAGCILVNGNRVKGLTTAAGLWTTACVGLSVGLGYYYISVAMALLMLVTMLALRPLGNRIQNRKMRQDYTLKIYLNNRESLKTFTQNIQEHEIQIVSVQLDEDVLSIKITNETDTNINHLVCSLMENSEIRKVEKI